jgi:hypothetical protein
VVLVVGDEVVEVVDVVGVVDDVVVVGEVVDVVDVLWISVFACVVAVCAAAVESTPAFTV